MDYLTNLMAVKLIYSAVLLILGLAIGSFLNVVVYRAPLGISLLHPPSSCPACGTRIAARDNVPLFGWLLLRGKCRSCRAPISWRYPAVETVTGILWAAEGWRLASLDLGFYANVFTGLVELAFLSSLVVTFLIDWDHKIILDEISLGGLALALAAAPFLPNLHHASTPAEFAAFHPLLDLLLGNAPAWWRSLACSLIGLAAGLGFSLCIYLLGNIAFKKQIEEARRRDPEIDSALGIGDIKLMTFYGAFLGWQAVFLIFIAGSVTGALAGSAMKLQSGQPGGKTGWAALCNRWRTGNSVVPFGPFLTIGALAALASTRLLLV